MFQFFFKIEINVKIVRYFLIIKFNNAPILKKTPFKNAWIYNSKS